MDHERHEQRTHIGERNRCIAKFDLDTVDALLVLVRCGDDKTCRIGKVLARHRAAKHTKLGGTPLHGFHHEFVVDVHQQRLDTSLGNTLDVGKAHGIPSERLCVRDDTGVLGVDDIGTLGRRRGREIDIAEEGRDHRELGDEQLVPGHLEVLLDFPCGFRCLLFDLHLSPDGIEKLRTAVSILIFHQYTVHKFVRPTCIQYIG